MSNGDCAGGRLVALILPGQHLRDAVSGHARRFLRPERRARKLAGARFFFADRPARGRRRVGWQLRDLPVRCAGKIIGEQAGHMVVARRSGGAAHHHGEKMAVAAPRAGHEIEAGGADIAGLDAVDTFDTAKKAVVIAVIAAAEGKGPGLEIGIFIREVAHDGAAEDRQIAGCRLLAVIRQAGGIAECGVAHAQFAGLAGHGRSEGGFAARDMFGDDDGDIIGRFGDESENRRPDIDGLAGAQSELGRRLGGGVLRNGHPCRQADAAALDLLEEHIESHDLGQRSRVAAGIGIARVKNAVGVHIDDDGGIFGVAPALAGRRGGRRQELQEQQGGDGT